MAKHKKYGFLLGNKHSGPIPGAWLTEIEIESSNSFDKGQVVKLTPYVRINDGCENKPRIYAENISQAYFMATVFESKLSGDSRIFIVEL